MNFDFLKVQPTRSKIVQKNWILHLAPPVVQVETPDCAYRVTATGVTYRMTKPLPEQITGCPFPGLVIELYMRAFMYKHRDKWPIVFLAIGALTAAIYTASALLLAEHPAAGEMVTNTFIGALLHTIGVLTFGFALYMAYGFWRSARYVYASELEALQERKLLASTTVPQWPDASPDILVVQGQNESGEEFVKRLAVARTKAGDGVWVVAFSFQHPDLTIWTSPTQSLVDQRCAPSFQDNWPEERPGIVPADASFVDEDYDAFAWYVNTYVANYRQWAKHHKIERAGNSAPSEWLNVTKKSAVVLLFTLFSFGASAQSAAAVEKALGTRIREIPAAGAEVSYVFAKKTLSRIGNGRANYVELLKAIPTYRDCCHGALIAVYSGETVVAKGSGAETVDSRQQAQEASMRPYSSAVQPTEEQRGRFSMPDSASQLEYIEQMKEYSRYGSERVLKTAVPWWNGFVEVYWEWFWLIAILTLCPWVIADLSAKEGFWDIYRPAKRIVILFTAASALLFVVSLMLEAKVAGLPNGLLAAIAVALAWASVKVLDRVNPDYRPNNGNDPQEYNPYAKRLPNGRQ